MRLPRWSVGQRLVEIATGRTWWVDESRSGQPEVVGVIPDEGPAVVEWRAMGEFHVRRHPPT